VAGEPRWVEPDVLRTALTIRATAAAVRLVGAAVRRVGATLPPTGNIIGALKRKFVPARIHEIIRANNIGKAKPLRRGRINRTVGSR
jgi:hypothetical protein